MLGGGQGTEKDLLDRVFAIRRAVEELLSPLPESAAGPVLAARRATSRSIISWRYIRERLNSSMGSNRERQYGKTAGKHMMMSLPWRSWRKG